MIPGDLRNLEVVPVMFAGRIMDNKWLGKKPRPKSTREEICQLLSQVAFEIKNDKRTRQELKDYKGNFYQWDLKKKELSPIPYYLLSLKFSPFPNQDLVLNNQEIQKVLWKIIHLKEAKTLFEIRELDLSGTKADIRKLFEPNFLNITYLEVKGDRIREFLAKTVEVLNFDGCRLDRPRARKFGEFKKLSVLSLKECRVKKPFKESEITKYCVNLETLSLTFASARSNEEAKGEEEVAEVVDILPGVPAALVDEIAECVVVRSNPINITSRLIPVRKGSS